MLTLPVYITLRTGSVPLGSNWGPLYGSDGPLVSPGGATEGLLFTHTTTSTTKTVAINVEVIIYFISYFIFIYFIFI